jgi:hypothetical protein
MYRKPSLILLLALFLSGCYGGSGYYESEVYTQPATVVGGGYVHESSYRGPYYQEQRIYVAPQPRYYSQSRYYGQPRYYSPPARYYSPPPVPRYYQPGRPPGQAWGSPGLRNSDSYRHRSNFRGDYRGGHSWRDHRHDRGGRDRGGWDRGGWQRGGGDYRRGGNR